MKLSFLKLGFLALMAAQVGCATFQDLFLWGDEGEREREDEAQDHDPEDSMENSDGLFTNKQGRACRTVNEEMKFHTSKACETHDKYEFIVGDTKYTYDKLHFRNSLREQIYYYLRTTAYPLKRLYESHVEVWMRTPVLMPDETYLVAVVYAPGGNFFFELPLHSDRWRFDKDHMALMGSRKYPDRGTKKPGVLKVIAKNSTTAQSFRHFLSETGIDSERLAWPIAIVETDVFSEPAVAQKIQKHRRVNTFVDEVTYLAYGQQEAYHAMALNFSFFNKP